MPQVAMSGDATAFPIVVYVHTTDIQERNGAPEVILDMLEGNRRLRNCFPMKDNRTKAICGPEGLGRFRPGRDHGKAETYQDVHRHLPAMGD